jgi:hypothetical protein
MRKTILVATLILAATFALAQNETVLYTFQGGSDGRQPMGRPGRRLSRQSLRHNVRRRERGLGNCI